MRNKVLQIFLVGLLVVTAVLITGCGEERKFNEGKQEVISLIAEMEKIHPSQENRKEFEVVKQKALSKLEEMERLTVGNEKLAYDYKKLKGKVFKATETWFLQKCHNETPKTMNPYDACL
jgi:outer membrane murein-binding lipoprotein Lpp